jgi:hypothetical protein
MGMTQENPKQPVRNLERITDTKFKTFELAKKAKDGTGAELNKQPVAKIKIFARNDNTFDVVWYKKIGEVVPEVAVVEQPKAKKVHGQTAKQRRANEKK